MPGRPAVKTFAISIIGTVFAGWSITPFDPWPVVTVFAVIGAIAGLVGRHAFGAVGLVVGTLVGWAALFLADVSGLARTFFNARQAVLEPDEPDLWLVMLLALLTLLAIELLGYAAGVTVRRLARYG
jgi:hypothetical protein